MQMHITIHDSFSSGFTGHEHLYDFVLINMNGRMLQKVEELTLYVIELQNQIDKLNKDRQ